MKILFFIIIVLFVGCSARSDKVLVVAKTNSYHRDKCIRTNMAKTVSMPIDEAISRHYDPCPLCMK